MKVSPNEHLSRCVSRNWPIKSILADTRISREFFLEMRMHDVSHTYEDSRKRKKISLLRRLCISEDVDSKISFGNRCDLDASINKCNTCKRQGRWYLRVLPAGATRHCLSRIHTLVDKHTLYNCVFWGVCLIFRLHGKIFEISASYKFYL